MPQELSFLLSCDAAKQRVARGCGGFVVHVEVSGDLNEPCRFVECDADDLSHAIDVAETWVHEMGKVSAAIRRVDRGGSLHKPCKFVS